MSEEEPPKEIIQATETTEATEAGEEDVPVKEEESTATFEPVVRYTSHTSTPNTSVIAWTTVEVTIVWLSSVLIRWTKNGFFTLTKKSSFYITGQA